MADNIAALCNALSTNEHFSTKDGDFKMNTTGSYRIARVYLDKHFFSFTYEELRNLAYIMYMFSEPDDILHSRHDWCNRLCRYSSRLCYFCGASLHRKQIYQLLSTVWRNQICTYNINTYYVHVCVCVRVYIKTICTCFPMQQIHVYLKTERACARCRHYYLLFLSLEVSTI